MTGQSYDYGTPVTVNIFRPFVTHARRTADLLLEKMKNKINKEHEKTSIIPHLYN